MKARPERVPASSAIWASLASRPYSARTLSKRRWKNSAEFAEDRVRAHQRAGGVERLRVGDAAEAGDLRPAHPAHEAAPGGDVHRRHRQVVDVDTLLRQQVQHVLGRLQHLREPVVAERGLAAPGSPRGRRRRAGSRAPGRPSPTPGGPGPPRRGAAPAARGRGRRAGAGAGARSGASVGHQGELGLGPELGRRRRRPLAGALRLGGGDAVDDELQARLAGGEPVERAGRGRTAGRGRQRRSRRRRGSRPARSGSGARAASRVAVEAVEQRSDDAGEGGDQLALAGELGRDQGREPDEHDAGPSASPERTARRGRACPAPAPLAATLQKPMA